MLKKILIIIVALGVAAFGWWTIAPLFINNEVQDELDPEIAALLEAADAPDTPAAQSAETSTFKPVAAESIDEDATDPVVTSPDLTETVAEESAVTVPAETSLPAPEAQPQTVVRGPFPIEDTRGHPASGNIRVIDSPEKGSLVRFENYDGTNGPDLRVYLATDLEATEFIDLGKAKGNQGNINYDVPSDVDLDDYQYVMTWCRAFGVLFDYAQIN